jgi:hypothetical protein
VIWEATPAPQESGFWFEESAADIHPSPENIHPGWSLNCPFTIYSVNIQIGERVLEAKSLCP